MAGLCLGHEGVAKVGDIDYFSFFKFLLFFFFLIGLDWEQGFAVLGCSLVVTVIHGWTLMF